MEPKREIFPTFDLKDLGIFGIDFKRARQKDLKEFETYPNEKVEKGFA